MSATARSDPVNILLVDDQPAKLLTYESILGELGENAHQGELGDEALDCLLSTRYRRGAGGRRACRSSTATSWRR